MAGDFNNVEDASDRLPVINNMDSSVGALDDLKVGLGLMVADDWRVTGLTEREYTFHRGVGHNAVFSRLDIIYMSLDLFNYAREWKIGEVGVRTDHSLVSVQMTVECVPIVGPGRPVFAQHMPANGTA